MKYFNDGAEDAIPKGWEKDQIEDYIRADHRPKKYTPETRE